MPLLVEIHSMRKQGLSSVSDADREIQTEGKRIMPGTRFTEFPDLSWDFCLHRRPTIDYFSYL